MSGRRARLEAAIEAAIVLLDEIDGDAKAEVLDDLFDDENLDEEKLQDERIVA